MLWYRTEISECWNANAGGIGLDAYAQLCEQTQHRYTPCLVL